MKNTLFLKNRSAKNKRNEKLEKEIIQLEKKNKKLNFGIFL